MQGSPANLVCVCVSVTHDGSSLALTSPPPQVVGDDMLCTNPERVKRGIEAKCVNALLLKVNQIGTITESIDAVRMSKEAGWGVMCSHRCVGGWGGGGASWDGRRRGGWHYWS